MENPHPNTIDHIDCLISAMLNICGTLEAFGQECQDNRVTEASEAIATLANQLSKDLVA